MTSEFEPSEKRSKEEIYDSFTHISAKTLLPQVLDAIPNICVVLNRERQIVFANSALLEFVGTDDRLSLCGLRPGEALSCIHAGETDDGCGATEFCRTCGAMRAILTCFLGTQDVQECRITRDDGQDMDLRVWTTQVTIEDQAYTVLTVSDISHEKRRRVFERLFFHDILNTAGALRGFSELLRNKPAEELEKYREHIYTLAQRLIAEIDGQRELSAAEGMELSVNPSTIVTTDVLEECLVHYNGDEGSKGRIVEIDPASVAVAFTSDVTLLRRVIGNLLKNAVEASQQGETITIGSTKRADTIEFWVHNPGFMPRDVQLQVFHRSFSTKGPGRGLGTYSARLLGERYLKGKVTFDSTPDGGTTFRIACPLHLREWP